MENTTTIGERIKHVREKAELSQKAFGKRVGLSQTAITALENNQTEPRLSTFYGIVDAFHVDSEWLRTGKGVAPETVVPAFIGLTLSDNGVVTSSQRPNIIPVGSVQGADGRYTTPTPGLTSGAATVAEAENVLLRQQLADKDKLIDRLWSMIPAALGKMISNLDAAGMFAGAGREVSTMLPA